MYFLLQKPKEEREPFVGAVYEPEVMISGNRKAEVAVIYLIMTRTGSIPDEKELFDRLFSSLEPRDFFWSDTRFVFAQAITMRAAGIPVSDVAAQMSWFARPEVVRQMHDHKLDTWFETDDGIERPIPASAILEIVIGGEFGTTAHLDWYIFELRKWRVVRGLRQLGFELLEEVDKRDGLIVLDWLTDSVEQLRKVAMPLRAITIEPDEAKVA
jgi:hypothetical protein